MLNTKGKIFNEENNIFSPAMLKKEIQFFFRNIIFVTKNYIGFSFPV